MKYNYTIKSLLLIFAMIMSVCGAWAEKVTISKTMKSIVNENEYTVSTGTTINTICTSIDLDDNISISLSKSGSGNTGSFWGTNSVDWRLYQTDEPSVTVYSKTGCTINTVKFTYGNTNTGKLNTSGCFTSVGSLSYINSGTAYDVDDTSVTYYVGNTSTKTNGQVKITAIEVKYETADGDSKTLSSIAVSGTPTKTTYFDGDKFDPAGLVVTGTYSDSNTETITSGITWNVTPETLTTGTTSVSVTATVGEITSASYTVNGLTVNKYPYIKDKLTQAITGVTSSTYGNFSGKSVVSDAVYAGNCAGGSGSVQLRTNNNNSGVISTTSGGYIRKVSVEWNASTTAGRVLDVYGSNTPYTSAADLYATNTRGTKLGSITNGTSTSLTITGDYKYVGIRSNDGAMYLTSVTFEWSPVSPVTFRKAGKGYSTLFTSESALTIPEDVEAYYCTLKENGNMEPHALTDVIPASTPVVLHYTGELTADKTINFAYSTEEGEDASANVLSGTDNDMDITSITENDFYVLSIVDGKVGFYKFGGDELAAGKAFYVTAKAPVTTAEFEVTFNETTFDVNPVEYSGEYFYAFYSVAVIEGTPGGVDKLIQDDIDTYGQYAFTSGALSEESYEDYCYNGGGIYKLYLIKSNNMTLVGEPEIYTIELDNNLELVGSSSTRGFILDFGFDGTTTGVSNVQTIAPAAKGSFDLQGRRVMGNAKGLLIKNGRVMLNR